MNKTAIALGIFLLSLTQAWGQKYFTRTSEISFHASTPLENIDATSRQATCFIDFTTGEVAYAVLMKSFQFKKALMEEHFNENYVESDKFPKSTFKGKILDHGRISPGKKGKYAVDVEGELTLHGVTKPVKTKGTLEINGDKATIKSTFVIVPEDYNIKIPSLVRDKIARTTQVNVESICEPYKK